MEEWWHLEDAPLPEKDVSAVCPVTRSVAGRFFDMYCNGESCTVSHSRRAGGAGAARCLEPVGGDGAGRPRLGTWAPCVP